jgi:hypothetical protein
MRMCTEMLDTRAEKANIQTFLAQKRPVFRSLMSLQPSAGQSAICVGRPCDVQSFAALCWFTEPIISRFNDGGHVCAQEDMAALAAR